jgi:hypothetical protein
MQYQTLLPVSMLIVLAKGTWYSESKEALSWVGESPIRAAYDRELNETSTGFTYKS